MAEPYAQHADSARRVVFDALYDAWATPIPPSEESADGVVNDILRLLNIEPAQIDGSESHDA